MTAIRGPLPEPLPVQPVQFSEQEIAALMLVKPAPYMDEADLHDPEWALPPMPSTASTTPVPPANTFPSQSEFIRWYRSTPQFINWYRALFGTDPA